jgi:hypothetical protein
MKEKRKGSTKNAIKLWLTQNLSNVAKKNNHRIISMAIDANTAITGRSRIPLARLNLDLID